MSDVPITPDAPPPDPEDTTGDATTNDPGEFTTYDDLAAVIREEVSKILAEQKVNNILVGFVTGTNPFTVRLLDGEDVQPILQGPAAGILSINDKVGLKQTVNGWIVTELIYPIGGPVSFGMVPVGAMMPWPRNTAPPPGWYIADGTNGTDDWRGVVFVSAGGGFSYGETGGQETHNHTLSGNTNNAGQHYHAVLGSTGSGGSHNHGGDTGQAPNISGARATGAEGGNYGNHVHPISGSGSHSHSMSGNDTNNIGSHDHSLSSISTSTKNNMPPYKTGHWIQFLGV